METYQLDDWDSYEKQLELIKSQLQNYKKDEYTYISTPLYRGQSNANWQLESTLERYLKKPASFDDYTRFLLRVKPAIESLTERKFDFKRDNDVVNLPMSLGKDGFLLGQYEFMAHLRHNSFPSPLLDWTVSPYVALYFAFHEANESAPVAIYVYVEHLGTGKGGAVGSPEIVTLGRYIQSHKRHYVQQSEYTICVERKNDKWLYCSHESAFNGSINKDQDKLIKLVIPGNQKTTILTKLDQMNINAFSLFGNEEGLMQMLAFREKDSFK